MDVGMDMEVDTDMDMYMDIDINVPKSVASWVNLCHYMYCTKKMFWKNQQN
jgi:hypothetical protein